MLLEELVREDQLDVQGNTFRLTALPVIFSHGGTIAANDSTGAMNTREAARRWAHTWATAWPLKDVEAIAALQEDDGDHFAEETAPAEAWFGEPRVDGLSATAEYWTVMYISGEPMTISGCTVLRFDDAGLVTEARDYSHVREGRHERPTFVR